MNHTRLTLLAGGLFAAFVSLASLSTWAQKAPSHRDVKVVAAAKQASPWVEVRPIRIKSMRTGPSARQAPVKQAMPPMHPPIPANRGAAQVTPRISKVTPARTSQSPSPVPPTTKGGLNPALVVQIVSTLEQQIRIGKARPVSLSGTKKRQAEALAKAIIPVCQVDLKSATGCMMTTMAFRTAIARLIHEGHSPKSVKAAFESAYKDRINGMIRQLIGIYRQRAKANKKDGIHLGRRQAQRARSLSAMIITPCCYTQPANIHGNDVAAAVNASLRWLVQRNYSDAMIKNAFVVAFGPKVLSIPQDQNIYLIPIVAALVMLLFTGIVVWRWRSASEQEDVPPEEAMIDA